MSAAPRLRLTPLEPTEQAIQASILRYLQHDYRVAGAWRINTGAHVVEDEHGRRFVRYHSIRGCSDILAIASTKSKHPGIWIALEVKRPGNKPTEEQRDFLDFILANGGIAGVVSRFEDAAKLLTSL